MAAMKSTSIKGGYYCNLSRFVRRRLAISQWHDGAEWWSALKVLISAFHCQWCGWNRKWHGSGLGSSWLIFSSVTRFSLLGSSWLIFSYVTWFSLFFFFVSLSSFLSFSIYRLDQNGQSLWSRVLQFYLLKRISPLKFIFVMLTRIETSKLLITYKF